MAACARNRQKFPFDIFVFVFFFLEKSDDLKGKGRDVGATKTTRKRQIVIYKFVRYDPPLENLKFVSISLSLSLS